MTAEIGFKAKFVTLVPSAPGTVPNGALFIDSTNMNQATFKDTSGNPAVVSAVSTNSLFIKEMQAEVVIPINTPVAKKANGKIIPADTDLSLDSQKYIGVTTTAAAAPDDLCMVLLPGANISGALTSLGFTPGQEIFLAENGGFTNDITGFTGSDDSMIKVGIADCTAGAASGIATDLIAFTEIIARP